jgi:hypothetical protein
MIKYQIKYKNYIKIKGVGSNDRVADSIKSYISYLDSVSRHLRITIGPKTLSSEIDIVNLSIKLKGKVSDKTIKNYGSAMRQYVSMVKSLGL